MPADDPSWAVLCVAGMSGGAAKALHDMRATRAGWRTRAIRLGICAAVGGLVAPFVAPEMACLSPRAWAFLIGFGQCYFAEAFYFMSWRGSLLFSAPLREGKTDDDGATAGLRRPDQPQPGRSRGV